MSSPVRPAMPSAGSTQVPIALALEEGASIPPALLSAIRSQVEKMSQDSGMTVQDLQIVVRGEAPDIGDATPPPPDAESYMMKVEPSGDTVEVIKIAPEEEQQLGTLPNEELPEASDDVATYLRTELLGITPKAEVPLVQSEVSRKRKHDEIEVMPSNGNEDLGVVEGLGIEVPPSQDISLSVGIEEALPLSEVPRKRKRGRPPKQVKEEPGISSATQIDNETLIENSEDSHNEADTPQKRKRGRPPKNTKVELGKSPAKSELEIRKKQPQKDIRTQKPKHEPRSPHLQSSPEKKIGVRTAVAVELLNESPTGSRRSSRVRKPKVFFDEITSFDGTELNNSDEDESFHDAELSDENGYQGTAENEMVATTPENIDEECPESESDLVKESIIDINGISGIIATEPDYDSTSGNDAAMELATELLEEGTVSMHEGDTNQIQVESTVDESPTVSSISKKKRGRPRKFISMEEPKSVKLVEQMSENDVSTVTVLTAEVDCGDRSDCESTEDCFSQSINTENKQTKKVADDSRTVVCEICGEVVPELMLKSHHNHHHKPDNKPVKNKDPMQCPDCGKVLTNAGSLRIHQKIHLNIKEHVCDHCGQKFSQKANLQKHIQSVHKFLKPHLCSDCGASFTQQAGLDYHTRTHRYNKIMRDIGQLTGLGCAVEGTDKTQVRCIFCEEIFINVLRFLHHIKQHVDSLDNLDLDEQENAKRDQAWSILKTHKDLLNAEKVYKCEQCSKIFWTPGMLAEHLQTHRNSRQELNYQCRFCDETFGSSSARNNHQRTHEDHYPHSCQDCHKRFAQEHQLRHHITVYHDETNPALERSKKTIKSGSKLKQVFKCSHCSKLFGSAYNLQVHERTHNKDKPFVCFVCKKSFADPSNLIAHGKRHHPDHKKELFTSSTKKRRQLTHEDCLPQEGTNIPQVKKEPAEPRPKPVHSRPAKVAIPRLNPKIPPAPEPDQLTSILLVTDGDRGLPESQVLSPISPACKVETTDGMSFVELQIDSGLTLQVPEHMVEQHFILNDQSVVLN